MLKQSSALAALFLCWHSLISRAGGCNENGPENCNFYHTFCSWQTSGDKYFYYYDGHPHDHFAGLADIEHQKNLWSRKACPTGDRTHCLTFWYGFEENGVLDLSVSIKYEGNGKAESPAWTTSGSYRWEYAQVPITTAQSFRVFFAARKRPGQQTRPRRVFIDDIFYWKVPCRLYPSDATPTTPIGTKPTTPSVSIATDTIGHLTPTTETMIVGPFKPNPKTNYSNESIDREPVLETTPVYTQNKPAPTSKQVGIIVGIIVAVLFVIVIVLAVLFVVLRKKRPEFWKTCCGQKQPKEQVQMNAADNVAYTLEAYDPNYVNEAVTNHNRQNSYNHRLETGASSQTSSAHCYDNQLSKTPSATVQEEESDGHSTIVGDTITRATSASPQGPGGEYSSLDFDKKSRDTDGKAEGATGAVYSQLNAGGEGTYNEVHRDKKETVIDGVYSHIQ